MTLQSVMNEVLKVRGCNFYDLPHLGKDKMLRQDGKLEQCLPAYRYEGIFNADGYVLEGMEVHVDRDAEVPME
jgi:hypothetical protein